MNIEKILNKVNSYLKPNNKEEELKKEKLEKLHLKLNNKIDKIKTKLKTAKTKKKRESLEKELQIIKGLSKKIETKIN